MLGIGFIVVISGILLYVVEKQNLLVLGFLPILKRLKQFIQGFLFTAALCVLTQLFHSFLTSSEWVLNNITSQLIINAAVWDLKSVLTEELIFRGALLYILIQKLGAQKALLISAIAFGVYHWFSYGILGNIQAMIFIFIGTALMGYALALAFIKAESIMFPIGLHLGWNFVYNTLFSNGPLGDLVFVSKGGNLLSGWTSLINFGVGLIVAPLLVIIYVEYFPRTKRMK